MVLLADKPPVDAATTIFVKAKSGIRLLPKQYYITIKNTTKYI